MQIAYFGEKNPAEGVPCPTCRARIGKPCTATVTMIGTCVSEGLELRGLHLERLIAVQAKS